MTTKIVLVDWFHDGYGERREKRFFLLDSGKIARSGLFEDVSDLNDLRKNRPELLDFRGNLVTPGLVDSHNHFTLTALKMLFQTDLGKSSNFDEIGNALRNVTRGDQEWVLGYNLNEFILDEKELPTSAELDSMVPDLPVVITHSSEHAAICNSLALRRAGITKASQDPPGSSIERYENGEPNGILHESAAMNLVKSKIPEPSLEEYMDAIQKASAEYRRYGLTAVKDIGGTGDDVNEWKRIDALNILSREGSLKIRVGASIPIYSLGEADEKIALSGKIEENDHLKSTGFKMFLDGSGLNRTGWMKEEWNKNFEEVDSGNFGMPLWNIDEFRKVMSKIATLGTTLSIHTIGDRAISIAVDIIEDLSKEKTNTSKYAFVHANTPDAVDIKRMSKLGISIETQAPDIYFLGSAYLANVGKKRAGMLFPFKTLLESGVNVCNGSDSPVMRYEPAYGIVASMTREMKFPPSFDEEYLETERLDLSDAIMTYTANCSRVMEWPEIGTLDDGSFADLVVWKKVPGKLPDDVDPGKTIETVIFSGNA